MGTLQSKTAQTIRSHHRDKRSTYPDTRGRKSGEDANGHRYTSAHQPQKQAVDGEKSKTVDSETAWAPSATLPAPDTAAPLSGLSQPEAHGLAGAHGGDVARTAGAASGDGPGGRADADRTSVSSLIRVL